MMIKSTARTEVTRFLIFSSVCGKINKFYMTKNDFILLP